ncbi:hypothetical protein D9M72_130040 [compost metagenome]
MVNHRWDRCGPGRRPGSTAATGTLYRWRSDSIHPVRKRHAQYVPTDFVLQAPPRRRPDGPDRHRSRRPDPRRPPHQRGADPGLPGPHRRPGRAQRLHHRRPRGRAGPGPRLRRQAAPKRSGRGAAGRRAHCHQGQHPRGRIAQHGRHPGLEALPPRPGRARRRAPARRRRGHRGQDSHARAGFRRLRLQHRLPRRPRRRHAQRL